MAGHCCNGRALPADMVCMAGVWCHSMQGSGMAGCQAGAAEKRLGRRMAHGCSVVDECIHSAD